jgi:hypothetical protein
MTLVFIKILNYIVFLDFLFFCVNFVSLFAEKTKSHMTIHRGSFKDFFLTPSGVIPSLYFIINKFQHLFTH